MPSLIREAGSGPNVPRLRRAGLGRCCTIERGEQAGGLPTDTGKLR
ncbi:MAG: hypothetical protein H6915_04795 [Novosphingobium sp.]|nr:hypothetical protein [Novosphingobium sp.]